MSNLKIRFLLPLFFGGLGALFLCAQFAFRGTGVILPEEIILDEIFLTEEIYSAAESKPERQNFVVTNAVQFFARCESEQGDFILKLYRQPETRERVIDFFAAICPSREMAKIILFYAEMFDISPALALALAWEESRLSPRAVNTSNRDGSIDRGLFQLNNRSFPHLETQAFFDIEVNTRYAMRHLRFCLNEGRTEVTALAMYNAGAGRVRSAGTPMVTLNYASRILENRRRIEDRFYLWINFYLEQERQQKPEEEKIPEIPEIVEAAAETIPERASLVPLMSLARMR